MSNKRAGYPFPSFSYFPLNYTNFTNSWHIFGINSFHDGDNDSSLYCVHLGSVLDHVKKYSSHKIPHSGFTPKPRQDKDHNVRFKEPTKNAFNHRKRIQEEFLTERRGN